jgi:hypothetical protein
MRYLMVWAAVVVATSGCAAGRGGKEDALVVAYRLDRRNAGKYFNLEHGFPVTQAVADNVRPENAPWSIAGTLALLLTVGVAEGVIGGVADLVTTTDVFMEVEGYPQFRQQVHRGENKVRVPKELAGRRVPIKLVFKGEYKGTLREEIDLTKQ